MDKLAIFETNCPVRHMETLCLHFGRKVEVDLSSESGWVQFPFGRCDMTAEQSRLKLRASAETEPQLDQVVQIMTSHLERFAFRENPTLQWHTPTT